MAQGLTLDTGALIAAEKGSRRFWAIWKEALSRGAPITIPAAVLAQAWRGKSPQVARLLPACVCDALDEGEAKVVGDLLGKARRSDVVDACVVAGASRRRDAIVTSDGGDIRDLLEAIRSPCVVLEV